jgi:hypothetical protein
LEPGRKHGVRSLARELERSVSTVSDVLSGLREARYLDEANELVESRLFWAVADRWSTDVRYLIEPPPMRGEALTEPLRLGLDNVGSGAGWALRGTAAASVLGAPVAIRADQPYEFFVPNSTVLHRAERLLGAAASPAFAQCSIAVAPVAAACTARFDPPNNYFQWPTTHPLFVALDLAQDAGRGREILRDWNPVGWSRVW